MKKIAIYGGGGFGREVLQIILDLATSGVSIECVGFVIDAKYGSPESIKEIPVFNNIESIDLDNCEVIIAIGSSHLRKKVIDSLVEIYPHIKFATLIHPKAWLGSNVEVGEGSIICAGCLITTDIKIGKHVHINIGSTIGHDATLSDFVTLNPSVNISGNVVINDGCEIGTGSVLIPRLNIGEWSIVGAGSVVTKSLPENITAVGGPAKIIKERESGWHKQPL